MLKMATPRPDTSGKKMVSVLTRTVTHLSGPRSDDRVDWENDSIIKTLPFTELPSHISLRTPQGVQTEFDNYLTDF